MIKVSKTAPIFLIFLLFSCSSGNPVDYSGVIPDAEADNDRQDPVIQDDSDEVPDAAPGETPDDDSEPVEKVECLDLREHDNVIKTNFPFPGSGSKPTLCRKGCDTPAENDPQCVRNIWEWRNWKRYQKFLSDKYGYSRECYPWPCELENADAKTKETLDTLVSSCDRLLSIDDLQANPRTGWSHGIYDGIVGMDLLSETLEYDPEKDRFTALGGNQIYAAFNENRYVLEVYDLPPGDHPNNCCFNISILKTDEGYFYELITGRNRELAYPPLSGKNWVVLPHKSDDLRYASTSDWKWHTLSGVNNYTGDGNIVGNHFALVDSGRLYYCDLAKYPDSVEDCVKINRKTDSGIEESASSVRIDAENESHLVYIWRQFIWLGNPNLIFNLSRVVKPIFVEVDLTNPYEPNYLEYEIVPKTEFADIKKIQMLKGNRLSYAEKVSSEVITGCFLRLDTGKNYCPEDYVFTQEHYHSMGYNVFWGKWHLWKTVDNLQSSSAIMRDWECYCEETGICPLEE